MKGVYFHKASRRWMACIWRNGKNEYIGKYETEVEAERAALKARTEKARRKPSTLTNPFEVSHAQG